MFNATIKKTPRTVAKLRPAGRYTAEEMNFYPLNGAPSFEISGGVY